LASALPGDRPATLAVVLERGIAGVAVLLAIADCQQRQPHLDEPGETLLDHLLVLEQIRQLRRVRLLGGAHS
jgi:hypothetical protein